MESTDWTESAEWPVAKPWDETPVVDDYRPPGRTMSDLSNRKRAREDDAESYKAPRHSNYNNGGSYDRYDRRSRGGGYRDRRPPRAMRAPYTSNSHQRRPDHPLVALQKDLVGLGVDSEVGRITEHIVSHGQNRKDVLDVILECVVQLPLKIPHLAAGVMLANARDGKTGAALATALTQHIKAAYEEGDCLTLKLMLRFMAYLQPMLDGCPAVLTQLLSVQPQVLMVIMQTMPYLVVGSTEDVSQPLTAIMATIEAGMLSYNSDCSSLSMPTPEHSRTELQMLWDQIVELNRDGWEINYLLRPCITYAEKLSGMTKHEIDVPPLATPDAFYGTSAHQSFYSPFDEAADLPSTRTFLRNAIRDAVWDTIDTLNYNRHEVAKQLVNMASSFPKDLADQYKFEPVIIEAIFARLFALPLPKFKEAYYASIIIETVKLIPQQLAPALGRCIRAVYNNLESLDRELIFRFIRWFTHHLSNFKFTYKWAEWVPDVDLPTQHPKRIFLQQSILNELSLSYVSRIKATLPDQLQQFLPTEDRAPRFDLAADDHYLAAEANEILQLANTGGSANEMPGIIERIKDKVDSPEEGELTAHEVIVSALLTAGSSSVTHFESLLKAFVGDVRENIEARPELGPRTARAILSVWRDYPYVGLVIMEQLLANNAIRVTDVIAYFFDASLAMPSWYCTLTGWDLTLDLLSKLSHRVDAATSDKEDLARELNDSYRIVIQQYEPFAKALIPTDLAGGYPWFRGWLVAFVRQVRICC